MAAWSLCGWWAAAIPTCRAARFHIARTRPPGDPLAAIEDLAAQVAAHGVRCVSADIVGDDTAYVWQPYADGWSIDDPVWDYGAPASALSVNDNTLSVTVLPGSHAIRSGAHCSDAAGRLLRDRQSRAHRRRRVERKITVDRLPGARQLRIWGTLPLNDPGDTEVLGIDDPALYAALAFRDALARRGIAIRGEARAVHLYPSQVADLNNGPAPEPEPGVELARRDSAPLVEDLRITDKVSQNLHAEMALAGGGQGAAAYRQPRSGDRGRAGVPRRSGHRSRQLYVRGWLGTVAPGPGNARGRGPPAGAHVPFGARGTAWVSLLPVAGQDGTLHARFADTAGGGPHFRQDRHAVACRGALGICAAGNGKMLAFSILVNNYNGPAADLRAAIDRVCALMLE